MKINRVLTGCAAAAMALVAGPALATGTSHTVSVGGVPVSPSSPVSFTATTGTSGGPNVLISARNNAMTIINLNCASSTLSGTVQPGIDILRITSSTWVSCTAPGGATTVSQVGNWSFHSGGSYTTNPTETVAGHLDTFEMDWQNTALPAICRFKIKATSTTAGLARTNFEESTQKLVINETGYVGNLKLQNVSGCGGQLQNGNPVDIQATYAVTATGGAINVTS